MEWKELKEAVDAELEFGSSDKKSLKVVSITFEIDEPEMPIEISGLNITDYKLYENVVIVDGRRGRSLRLELSDLKQMRG